MNSIISSLIIQATNGNTAMGPILDKIEGSIEPKRRHLAYCAVAKAYYQYIKYDHSYIDLTKELCLRDLELCQANLIADEENDCLDILAITAANYFDKKEAIDIINTIIDSGFAFTKYIKLKEMIESDKPRIDRR